MSDYSFALPRPFKKMSRISTAVAKLFAANPLGIALLLIAHRAWRGVASSAMAYSLHAPGLHLGPGCRVIGGRHISFGRDFHANRNLWLEAVTSYRSQHFSPTITIGNSVSLSDGVHISAIQSIVIGSHVLMGSRIYISDHNHGIYCGEQQSHPGQPPSRRVLGGSGLVIIGDNVWIGDNSVIVGPASIGSGAIIGANSLVRGTVPPNSIAAGTPARVLKQFNPQTGSWDKV
jgi:acetyltransferase-like isoleucine patch superfamily enzyme